MDNNAVETLLQTGAEFARLSDNTINEETNDLIALPKDVMIHDLERYRLGRRRFRGQFKTSSLADFVAYVKDNASATEGAGTKPDGFIAPDEPTALMFFNLYNNDTGAGHADWTGRLELEKTAAYKSLLAIEGKPLTQRSLVDWIEDWQDAIAAIGSNGDVIRLALATAAIGKLDIKSSKQSGHTQEDFKQARSTLEQVEANIGDAMPVMLVLGAAPYHGLKGRDFRLRISILTSHDDPRLVLRIVQKEAVEEDIVKEFKARLAEEIGDSAKLTIGSFQP